MSTKLSAVLRRWRQVMRGAWLRIRSWRPTVRRMKRIAATVTVAAPVLGLVASAILTVVYELSADNAPIMQPIAVPPALADRGYTSTVMARQIADAYHTFRTEAQTSAKTSEITVGDTSSDLVLNDSLSTFTAIVARGARFLHLSNRQVISGEVTQDRQGKYWLRLRLNGHRITDYSLGPAETPDALLAPAGMMVARALKPYLLASWYSKKGRLEKAEEEAKSIILWKPSSDENVMLAHNLLGMIYRNRKEYDAALEKFDLVEKLGGQRFSFHNRGTVFESQGKWDKAEQEYLRAIKLDPRAFRVHSDLGWMYLNRGYLDRKYLEPARREFEKAIEYSPAHPNAHRGLGEYYGYQGMLSRQIQEYEIATLADSTFAGTYFALARAYAARKDYQRSLVAFRKTLALSPRFSSAYYFLGRTLMSRADSEAGIKKYSSIDEACEAFESAYAFRPLEDKGEDKIFIESYPGILEKCRVARLSGQ